MNYEGTLPIATVPQDLAASGGNATFLRTLFNTLNALMGASVYTFIMFSLFFYACIISYLMNLCISLTGVGLLSVPFALSEGGWLSLLLFIAVACTCCYTGLLLRRCMAADPTIRTYPDIGIRAFGNPGGLFVSTIIYVELYLVATGFLIIDGDNLHELFPNAKITVGSVSLTGRRLFIVMVALVIMPITWLRRMGRLAYISATGVLASVVVVLCVLWAGLFNGVGFNGQGTPLRFRGLPVAVGLYTFCYSSHPIFPSLYNAMDNTSRFSKMLFICFGVATVNYAMMAVLGYLMFGKSLQSQITLNLPSMEVSAKVAIYTTLIVPASKFALIISPVAIAIEERMGVGSVLVSMLLRTLLVLSTVVVAISVPFFGYLMAFVGSLLSVSASMLLTCVCYVKIFGASAIKSAELFFIVAILVLGTLVAVTGTYLSIMEIAHAL